MANHRTPARFNGPWRAAVVCMVALVCLLGAMPSLAAPFHVGPARDGRAGPGERGRRAGLPRSPLLLQDC